MKSFFILSLVMSFFSASVNAQKIQSHVLELQNRIEMQIDRNLSNLISTQLAPTTFEISSRVKVVEVPPAPAKPDKKKEANQWPAGMELGSIDVREVIEAYKAEIEQLKIYREATKEVVADSKFNITGIEIVVGLSDVYDDAYIAQFGEWLTKRVKYDYGAVAKATVNRLKTLPVKEIEPVKPGIKDFLPLLNYLALALGFILAAWFISSGLKRLSEGAKNISIEHKNAQVPELLEKSDEGSASADGTSDPASSANLEKISQESQLLIGKIGFLHLELGRGVNELVRLWMDNGTDGFLKTAVLVDLIITIKEKLSTDFSASIIEQRNFLSPEIASAISSLEIPLDEDLAHIHGVSLSEAYRETSRMTLETKLSYFEKIYWDLLQIKTLGLQNMRKPFDYLQSMNDLAYSEVLNTQADDAKALALMFGDAQKSKIFLSSMNTLEKEKIVVNMLKMSQVSKKQIWDIDSSVKLRLLNSSMNPSEEYVNLFPRTIEMLNSMSPMDEILVLRKIVQTLPDGGSTLKQQYTTLAFVDEWNVEYIDKLIKISTSSELVHLIQLIPECANSILAACPEKLKMIITDDLKMQNDNQQDVVRSLKQLKSKFKNLCVTESIPMGKVVSFDKPERMKNAV